MMILLKAGEKRKRLVERKKLRELKQFYVTENIKIISARFVKPGCNEKCMRMSQ